MSIVNSALRCAYILHHRSELSAVVLNPLFNWSFEVNCRGINLSQGVCFVINPMNIYGARSIITDAMDPWIKMDPDRMTSFPVSGSREYHAGESGAYNLYSNPVRFEYVEYILLHLFENMSKFQKFMFDVLFKFYKNSNNIKHWTMGVAKLC